MTEPPSPAPRRPFADAPAPEPFHRTPEFRRFAVLAGVLAVFAVVGFTILSQLQRNRAASERAERDRQAAVPKVLTPEEAQARRDRLLTVFEGALLDSENGTDFAETTGYRKLLQVVQGYPEGEIEARATRRLDYAAAMADPDAWRGEFVWTRGIVLNLYAERLREPLFGMTDVYRGILADGNGQDALFFDLPQDVPPDVDLRRDPVDVFGIFYRTVSYEALSPLKDEPAVRTVPHLVVGAIRPVPEGGSPTGFLRDNLGLMLVAAGVVIFTGRLLIYLVQRRSRRTRAPAPSRGTGFRDMFETKLRQERRTRGPSSHA